MTRRTFTVASVLAVLALASAALASPLHDAKRAGQVGERYDGFLGVVSADAPAKVRKLVDDINAKRRAEYAAIAKKNGTTVEAVGAITGKKLIERASSGEYVMPGNAWVRK